MMEEFGTGMFDFLSPIFDHACREMSQAAATAKLMAILPRLARRGVTIDARIDL